jgi:hypothetical protein
MLVLTKKIGGRQNPEDNLPYHHRPDSSEIYSFHFSYLNFLPPTFSLGLLFHHEDGSSVLL